MQDFIKKNGWNLLTLGVGLIIAWTMLNARVDALAAQVQDNKSQIVQYSELVERVVKLEENRSVVASDIGEIKEDIKDLKKHFNLIP